MSTPTIDDLIAALKDVTDAATAKKAADATLVTATQRLQDIIAQLAIGKAAFWVATAGSASVICCNWLSTPLARRHARGSAQRV